MNDTTITPDEVKQRKPRSRVKNSVRYLAERKKLLKTAVGLVIDECLQVSNERITEDGQTLVSELDRNIRFITTSEHLSRYRYKDAVRSRNFQSCTFAQKKMTNLLQSFLDDLFETKDTDINNLSEQQVETGMANFVKTKEKYLNQAKRNTTQGH